MSDQVEQKREPYEIEAENALKVWNWLQTRGGIVKWESANLSNPGASWTGPLYDVKGGLSTKPTWQAADRPARVITSAEEIVVVTGKEVDRFKIAIRPSGNGLSLKLTDHSSQKLRAKCNKYPKSWYEFDYNSLEAVIFVPDSTVPLTEFVQNLQATSNAQGTIAEGEQSK